MDVWNSIKKRASDMDREAIDLKRKAEAKDRLRRQQNEEILEWTLVAVIALVLVVAVTFMIVSFFDATKGLPNV